MCPWIYFFRGDTENHIVSGSGGGDNRMVSATITET